MTDMTLTVWTTTHFKRVARSSLGAEIQQACNTDDELFAARPLWSDIHGCQLTKHNVTDAAKSTPGIIVLDAKVVYDAMQNSIWTSLCLTEKRSVIELLGLSDSMEEHDTDLRWCHSDIQLVDGMTRKRFRK